MLNKVGNVTLNTLNSMFSHTEDSFVSRDVSNQRIKTFNQDTMRSAMAPPPMHSPQTPIVRVTSSTFHLSQIALRELHLRLRLELPDFPPENLLVELGPYGSFDVHIGSLKICEASKTVVYPSVSGIVTQLARVMSSPTGMADLRLLKQQEGNSEQCLRQMEEKEESEAESRFSSSSSSLEFFAKLVDEQPLVSPDGILVSEDPMGGGSGGV